MAFSQEDLSINPYADQDTAAFIGSLHDTLVYSGPRITEGYIVTEYGTMDDELALYGCRGQWYNSQLNRTELSGNDRGDLDITLRLPDFHLGNSVKTFTLVLTVPDDSVAGFGAVLNFDKGKLMNLPGNSVNGHIEAFLDSVSIGPKVYHDVYKIFEDPDAYQQTKYTDWVQRVYYSVRDGVVGFTLKKGRYYYNYR